MAQKSSGKRYRIDDNEESTAGTVVDDVSIVDWMDKLCLAGAGYSRTQAQRCLQDAKEAGALLLHIGDVFYKRQAGGNDVTHHFRVRISNVLLQIDNRNLASERWTGYLSCEGIQELLLMRNNHPSNNQVCTVSINTIKYIPITFAYCLIMSLEQEMVSRFFEKQGRLINHLKEGFAIPDHFRMMSILRELDTIGVIMLRNRAASGNCTVDCHFQEALDQWMGIGGVGRELSIYLEDEVKAGRFKPMIQP